MANICSNYIVFSNCDKDKYEKIKSIFEGIENIKVSYDEIPFYDELMKFDIESEDGFSHKFGTKWIDVLDISDYNNNTCEITCETAWCPCLGLSQMIAKLFDVYVTHDYSECGCDFGGRCKITKDSYNDDSYKYLEYLYTYDEEQFYYELEYIFNEVYDGDHDAMIADDRYAKYSTEIKTL